MRAPTTYIQGWASYIARDAQDAVPYTENQICRARCGHRALHYCCYIVGTIAPIVRALDPHNATIVGAGFHPRPCPPWMTVPDRP